MISIGYGFAIGGSVLFSTKGIFIKLAYAHGVATETLLALRMLVALPVYLVILVTLLRDDSAARALLTPKTVLASMAVGILGYYLSSYLDFAGLNFLSAQYERLVLFTYPFFVLIFGVWFFGDRMVWRVVPRHAGFLCRAIGHFRLEPGHRSRWAVDRHGLVLGSAITFALYQHLAKRQMVVIGSGLFTCIGMSTAAICAIAQNTILFGAAEFHQPVVADVDLWPVPGHTGHGAALVPDECRHVANRRPRHLLDRRLGPDRHHRHCRHGSFRTVYPVSRHGHRPGHPGFSNVQPYRAPG